MLPVNQPVQLGLADVRMHFQQGACQPDKGRQADGERSIQGKRLSARTGRQDRPVTDQRIARATVDTFGETYTVEKYGTR